MVLKVMGSNASGQVKHSEPFPNQGRVKICNGKK